MGKVADKILVEKNGEIIGIMSPLYGKVGRIVLEGEIDYILETGDEVQIRLIGRNETTTHKVVCSWEDHGNERLELE